MMSYSTCYWCGQSCQLCPECLSEDSKQPACIHCRATGYICREHEANWMGSVYCPPTHEPIIDTWITSIIRNSSDIDKVITVEDLPFSGRDELSYTAFICDLNAARSDLHLTDSGLRRAAILVQIRNLAVQAGGARPNILRSGDLP